MRRGAIVILALVLIGAAAVGALIARGGDDRTSVLHEGIVLHGRVGYDGLVKRFSDDEARAAAQSAEAAWRRSLRSRADAAPGQHFSNLAPERLRARLKAAARRNDFEVVSVDLLRPKELAPRIVVRTDDYMRLARAMPEILRTLDPKARTNDDRTGWRYEGFFFEARDGHDVPFALVFNFWRGPGGGGGQWARSERLYPFVHL